MRHGTSKKFREHLNTHIIPRSDIEDLSMSQLRMFCRKNIRPYNVAHMREIPRLFTVPRDRKRLSFFFVLEKYTHHERVRPVDIKARAVDIEIEQRDGREILEFCI